MQAIAQAGPAAHAGSRGGVGALAGRLDGAAVSLLRYSLVAILLYFGAFKFTAVEAEAIRPLVAASPFLGWTYSWLSVQWVSNLIGVTEIAIALLMAARRFAPRLSGWASLAAAGTFAVTTSFLVTTPGMWTWLPEFPLPLPSATGSFILKDVFLLGAALATAAEALAAGSVRRCPGP